jgi:hypothetical protein
VPASNSSTSTSSTDSARASLGLTHPAELTAASAGWWTTLTFATSPGHRRRCTSLLAKDVRSLTPPSPPGIAARHGCHPLRGVATYEDVYKVTYVRGPSGILVMLAEELNKS